MPNGSLKRFIEMLFYNLLSCLVLFQRAWASLPLDWRNRFDPETLAIQEVQSRKKNLHDNDIIWDEDDGVVFRNPLMRSGRLTPDEYWPNNGQGIPYDITHSNAQDKQKIENALRIIEQRTGFCVSFRQRNEETEYIKFQPGRSCSSNIGRITGHRTKVILHTDCLLPGIIQHEILHALGFFHEQNRPDRDQHIDIDLENIKVDIDPINYQKLPEMATYDFPYDFESIMHYGPFDMSRNCHQPGEAQRRIDIAIHEVANKIRSLITNLKSVFDEISGHIAGKKITYPFRSLCRPVIAAKRGQHRMGQRTGLSILDVARIQMAYNCSLDHLASERAAKGTPIHRPAVARTGNESTFLEPFPNFSSDPMTLEQCARQFSTNCGPGEYTTSNCTKTRTLRMSCKKTATPSELQDMALDLSEEPLRAISVYIYDGRLLRFDNFAMVRKQVLELHVYYCHTTRTTAELPKLQFSNLLSFWLINCYGLRIKRMDFAHSIQLKEIVLATSTTHYLESGAFSDLPGLKHLTLEFGFHERTTFSRRVREYLTRLHCGCEFAWFRQWWDSNQQLLRKAAKGEVFAVPNYYSSSPRSKNQIYLPIDCSVSPFPTGAGSIDFTQEEFSINVNTGFENDVSGCAKKEADPDPLPVFSTEPMTSKQCALQFTANCAPHDLTRSNCTDYPRFDINCTRQVSAREFTATATAMARLTPRPITVDLFDGVHVSFANFAPVRRQVMTLYLRFCQDDRTTAKLYELRLVNLVGVGFSHCYNLNILKRDFQRTPKLRIIELSNSTVLTLEQGTFSDLPSLRILSLELKINDQEVFSQYIRDYLFRLHCSCEFAWYRRWWSNNTALLREAESGEVYLLPDAWRNGEYSRSEIYLPVDCDSLPTGSDSIDFDQTEFSVNEQQCPA